MEKIFPDDVLSKRERIERTLDHRPVDRVALHEQLSYNPAVIARHTGKRIEGFGYTLEDICATIRRTLDICFFPVAPRGTARVTDEAGFVTQHDNWTSWHVSRPFTDEAGARDWLAKETEKIREATFDPEKERMPYREELLDLQRKVGETVLWPFSATGFCGVFDAMGLELFSYFYADYPDVMHAFMEVSAEREVQRVHAVADRTIFPVVLIAEDFATKHGPIFRHEVLEQVHYPHVRRLTEAWHSHDIKVIYHSDGNYRKAIPDLMACGVDGFYCLEPNCGMDIVALKNTCPDMVWAGGVDGVDLMERGTPEQVRGEVHRHIRETHALKTGGMLVATSSEINPPIPPENFEAMVGAVGELRNREMRRNTP
ncbi:MAG: uroporphyrinogen decarboxylase family protein [Candidatus Latescibacterota bacterium]